MKIFRVLPDYKNSLAFTLPIKSVLLGLHKGIPHAKLMHFNKHNLSLKSSWTDFSAHFEPIKEVNKKMLIPDISVWVPGTLVFSQSAIKVVPCLESAGELLPVQTPSGPYWIFNCMREIQADEPYSRHIVESGQIIDIQSLRFPEEEAKQAQIFKTAFDGYRNLFCSETIRDKILKEKLIGLSFSENLVGGFE